MPEEPLARQDWVPPDIDAERPSAARVYDYFLGGAHNFAVDRRVADQIVAAYPVAPLIAQTNRAFLRRAVEYLVDAGIRQFLDIGSGIPTVGHVHEIAHRTAPDARIVFVDIDPIAVAHSHLILADNDRTTVIQQDIRHPEDILDHPDTGRLLDLAEPVAVLVVALLHFLPATDDPADLLARVTAPLATGSYLALSHFSLDGIGDEEYEAGMDLYRRSGMEVISRTRPEVEALFSGFELAEPGLVWVSQWRPDGPDVVGGSPEASRIYAGVARKP